MASELQDLAKFEGWRQSGGAGGVHCTVMVPRDRGGAAGPTDYNNHDSIEWLEGLVHNITKTDNKCLSFYLIVLIACL